MNLIGKMIVKQPNGKYALVNKVDNTFEITNFSVEEIKDRLIDKATRIINSDIVASFKERAHDIENNDDPLFEYTCSIIKASGLLDSYMKDELRAMGMSV